ncbi:hypothetical protein COCSUDRAFT_32594 [Coccomyxa subellipsoidea C-169]|uniref:Uncharacterized protein n=1 Tax=Coccomyxa subellipsoidea (strain C-169) TaxID=574566 RepID=I0Z3N3_COCSC|nr:hypothetical protein COCSUDRAFT_32594 [Coccomyxa subellipsoidea C-169]EIE25252.1 hypothetical protein COCSUDRAFT_32594 [Coccomyxa subellipsoidea C-169]|eukprot:XP_005649796.1 hypothetical protein COCSUDRAFT_32594 [Coccomyxa subellipsoidea C-169]
MIMLFLLLSVGCKWLLNHRVLHNEVAKSTPQAGGLLWRGCPIRCVRVQEGW